MKAIWKFQIPVQDIVFVPMPVGAKVLSAQKQDMQLCLWALVDPDEPLDTRTFHVFGTGNPIYGDPGKFIGTVQTNDGMLVWHVFEAMAAEDPS